MYIYTYIEEYPQEGQPQAICNAHYSSSGLNTLVLQDLLLI